ncbi:MULTISPECIES: nuclear transport factor 2 family protein [unclassified Sphingobium]|uniref:nuclear transport factor 2 family protein n=1 Tax=unclassified Sphingobium TaxID=2611147 RepID=UPI002224A337|nr:MULTISPECIES: nuclear transport factor 2 family protein [unclassified Sphingobium]MCW2394639.1 ketosteroid isomerase-like protein [Sphingobium sp. B8D3B]MCW2418153.1 ketosteroid isomerase-like protein [Sphingobium sp. B8D3C]
MTRDEMMRFAARWIANWNARDLEAVLSHFAEDAHFISPLAREVTGSPIIEGKAALRAYWSDALAVTTDMHFTLIAAVCDIEAQVLDVHYLAQRNGRSRRALETMRFVDSKQVEGEAFFGIDLTD